MFSVTIKYKYHGSTQAIDHAGISSLCTYYGTADIITCIIYHIDTVVLNDGVADPDPVIRIMWYHPDSLVGSGYFGRILQFDPGVLVGFFSLIRVFWWIL